MVTGLLGSMPASAFDGEATQAWYRTLENSALRKQVTQLGYSRIALRRRSPAAQGEVLYRHGTSNLAAASIVQHSFLPGLRWWMAERIQIAHQYAKDCSFRQSRDSNSPLRMAIWLSRMIADSAQLASFGLSQAHSESPVLASGVSSSASASASALACLNAAEAVAASHSTPIPAILELAVRQEDVVVSGSAFAYGSEFVHLAPEKHHLAQIVAIYIRARDCA